MARNFLVAAPGDSLGATIRRMREGRQSIAPLLESRKLRAADGADGNR